MMALDTWALVCLNEQMWRSLSVRDLFIALASLGLIPVVQWVLMRLYATTDIRPTIIAGAAIVVGFLVIAFLDWAIWKDDKKERARLNDAFRNWELATGETLGRASIKRSARWWWRPIRNWWLMKRR